MESQTKQFITNNRELFKCITSVTGAFVAESSNELIVKLLQDQTASERDFYGSTIYIFSDDSCIVRIDDEYIVDVDSSMFEE